jgi:hypothetical protein
MLYDPAPFGRGSEGLFMGQQGRGYRSVLISIGDFHGSGAVPLHEQLLCKFLVSHGGLCVLVVLLLKPHHQEHQETQKLFDAV